MANSGSHLGLALLLLSLFAFAARARLSPTFYDYSCPSLQNIVRSTMQQAVSKEARMGASILRLHFHDCFVKGCDGSILLDDTPTFIGEKNAFLNKNSLRGYEVIDAIKSNVEGACPGTVSCADILALAARDGVVLLGGPTWTVNLGRRDARTASLADAEKDLPNSRSNISTLLRQFGAKGLGGFDLTALSGAHTIGLARCLAFRDRIYREADIDPSYSSYLKQSCPSTGGDNNLAPLDQATPEAFDVAYYQNLVAQKGLLHSDQGLFNGGPLDALVQRYSINTPAFFADFVAAIVRMGNISPLTGTNGEIRLNCRQVK